MKREARLILSDGTEFCGFSFGYDGDTVGEVVFNTAMTGYPESLTDPSYAGQILVTTYPLIGNYGVPDTGIGSDGLPLFMESDRIHAKALVVADYSEQYSHWNAKESLANWLKREKVPGITGIDTRRLTMVLREQGVMMGRVVVNRSSYSADLCPDDYGSVNWVEQVSCKEIISYRPEIARKKVVLVDCGVKANIIRCLIKRGIEVVRVPWDYDFNELDFDGLFLANGPGDPEQCGKTVDHIRTFLSDKEVRPCMGICLGNQLLAKAAAGDWEPLFVNMNDGSNEGIRHKTNPWMSAQFHPEACSGPVDTEFLFDEFVKMLG